MEHEMFQSKLKPLVDDAVFSEIVEGSSLGEQPYRAEAMKLVLEGSIRERRKRMVATKNPQPDSTTRPKRGKKKRDIPIQPPVPAPPPQESPQLPSDPIAAHTSGIDGASPESSTLPKPPGKSKTQHEKSPAISKGNLFSERTVELVCSQCGLERHPFRPMSNCLCEEPHVMKCSECGTTRAGRVDTCTGCHGKFMGFWYP